MSQWFFGRSDMREMAMLSKPVEPEDSLDDLVAKYREMANDADREREAEEWSGFDITPWFEKLDKLNSEPFMPTGRRQPATPRHHRHPIKSK
jgi:hypothetical protein